MLESNLSAIWGFAGEWCLVGTAPFCIYSGLVWYAQNITPLVKPSVKLRVWAEPSVTQESTQNGRSLLAPGSSETDSVGSEDPRYASGSFRYLWYSSSRKRRALMKSIGPPDSVEM